MSAIWSLSGEKRTLSKRPSSRCSQTDLQFSQPLHYTIRPSHRPTGGYPQGDMVHGATGMVPTSLVVSALQAGQERHQLQRTLARPING
jgi:hypothetical protein